MKYFDVCSDALHRSDHLILAEIEGNRSGFINLLVLWAKNSQQFSGNHLKCSLVYTSQIL